MRTPFLIAGLIFYSTAYMFGQGSEIQFGAVRFDQQVNRKPTQAELAAIAPSPALFREYSEFLKQPHTGLFKLVVDRGCADNERILRADEYCAKYSLPGAGASFSFRTGGYRVRKFADLTYSSGKFISPGDAVLPILTMLGDVPPEDFGLGTRGMTYLADYRPLRQWPKVRDEALKFANGVNDGGFLYCDQIPVANDTTYALRSIAYRGLVPHNFNGWLLNELDFDKRRDVIVIFRVVESDADGSVSILWRELEDQRSPSLKNH